MAQIGLEYGNIFKVLYAIGFMPDTLMDKLEEGYFSMSSPYEDTKQYPVNILTDDYDEEKDDYDEDEQKFIQYLIDNDIDYIEI